MASDNEDRRSLPLLGDLLAFRADRLAFLTRLARTQGDVATFRIGPYRAWQLTDPAHVHGVLVTHADRFRKGPVLQRARIVLGEGLLTSEGGTHRADRRVLQPAFHPTRVDGYAEVMATRAHTAARRWVSGEPFDLHAETVRITLATAGATLLGTEVEGDVATVEQAIDDLLSAYKLAFVPFGWHLQRLPLGPPRRLRRGRAALHGLVDRAVADRRATGHDAGDLLSMLALDSGWSDAKIREHALTLLLAGHETTANALAFAFHLLATHPEVEAQVHAEVDEVVAEEPVSASAVDRLPTCRAVMAESLRLYPPSWAMARQATHDHHVDGQVIRTGELAVLPQWVVHRDPRWWPDPERCVVDRWSDGEQQRRPRWSYFPFGAGVRRCIGEGFAWTEGVLALATIARQWRLAPMASRPLRLEPLITLRPRDGIWFVPQRR